MERNNIISECKYIGFKNNRLNYGLIEKFPNIYRFCNGDINTFILLLRKGIYPCEYMDSWEKFNETSLPDKEYF